MNIIETIQAAFNFFPVGLAAAMSVVSAASVVTAVTPTPRDDHFAGSLYKILEILALNIGHAKNIAPNKMGGRFVA